MPSLADLPEVVGFFSYSRDDDRDSDGGLSTLRRRIQNELRAQMGRSEKSLRLWQDAEAIPPGTLWESQIGGAVEQAVFFIPIVTPRVINSEYCKIEFENFLRREKELHRSDLVFPILYINVPQLKDEKLWRNHDVLKVIGERQYVDWCDFRFDINHPNVHRSIAEFASTIITALERDVPDPRIEAEKERAKQEAEARLEAERTALEQAEKERARREAEARLQAERAAHEQAEKTAAPERELVQLTKAAEEQRQRPSEVASLREAAAHPSEAPRSSQSGPSPQLDRRNGKFVGMVAAIAVGVVLLAVVVLALNGAFRPQASQQATAPTPSALPSAPSSPPSQAATAPPLSPPPSAAQTPIAPPTVTGSPTPTPSGANTIKIGVLFSLTGMMVTSESPLKDVVVMMVDDLNQRGGLLGKRVEAVVVDPASNWPLFAEKAKQLLSIDKVAVVFGCWTSVSRKTALPVFEQLNGLLFYPVQYEGEESSNNVFYTGAVPNQQAIPAVDYLINQVNVKRWVLAGTDYVYPRTTNTILEAYLKSKGVTDADLMINYTPFGYSDWPAIVAKIKVFGSVGKKTAVISTIDGEANVPFYEELANQGIKATDIPVIALSVGEQELARIDTTPLVGHLAAWNYFQSVKNPVNQGFIKQWHDFSKDPKGVTNDPMEAVYVGFNMWVHAVQQAGTTNVDAVRQAMYGQQVQAPSGYVEIMATNHHLSKPLMVGEIQPNGQFNIISRTKDTIAAVPWSPYLPNVGH